MTSRIALGDICEFAYGDALRADHRKAGAVPVYGSNGVVGTHDRAITSAPAIVIGRKGSIGEVHWSAVPCYPIDTTYFVDRTKQPCHLKWLYYGLRYLDLTRLNKAAAVPGLNRDDAYELSVYMPSPPQQTKIVERLDAATLLISTRRHALQLCDEFLPAAFFEMFGDPRTNPRHLPRATIADLGTVETGSTPPRDRKEYFGSHIEWIKSDNITTSQIHPTRALECLSAAGERVGTAVDSQSVLVTCIAGSLASIGTAVLTDRRVAFNQQINAIIPHADVDPLFLYALMLVAKPIVQAAATEAMKKMITKSKLEDVLLFKPDGEAQRKFATVTSHWSATRDTARESCRQADHLFQTLLHEAFAQ